MFKCKPVSPVANCYYCGYLDLKSDMKYILFKGWKCNHKDCIIDGYKNTIKEV
jgi:hypothetical protein